MADSDLESGDYGVVLTFGCASCVVCIRALKKAEAAQVR
jgi:hypothetical protein